MPGSRLTCNFLNQVDIKSCHPAKNNKIQLDNLALKSVITLERGICKESQPEIASKL